jgi:hypothetical protein
MNSLKDCLDNLWYNVIDDIKVDVFNHRIIFNTRARKDETIIFNQITLEEVSSFYFVEGIDKDRFNLLELEEGDFLELTSIDYHPKGIGLIAIKSKTEDWVQQYISNSNFSIEIWSSMLFVEAKRAIINEIVFDVGYPQ